MGSLAQRGAKKVIPKASPIIPWKINSKISKLWLPLKESYAPNRKAIFTDGMNANNSRVNEDLRTDSNQLLVIDVFLLINDFALIPRI
jgi:hypothetical protein